MLKTKTIVLIAAAAVVPLAGIAYYKYVEANYDVSFEGITIKSITSNSISLVIDFLITNNTGISVQVLNSSFDIYVNGSKIGIAIAPQMLIPNKTVTKLSANIVADKSGIQSAIFDLIFSKLFSKNTTINAAVTGNIKIQPVAPVLNLVTFNVPVEETYDL